MQGSKRPRGGGAELLATPGANSSLDCLLLSPPPCPNRQRGRGVAGRRLPALIKGQALPSGGLRRRPGRCSGIGTPGSAPPPQPRLPPNPDWRGTRGGAAGDVAASPAVASALRRRPGLEKLPWAGRDRGAALRPAPRRLLWATSVRPPPDDPPGPGSPGTGRPRTRAGPGGRRWWRWAGPAGPPPPSHSR